MSSACRIRRGLDDLLLVLLTDSSAFLRTLPPLLVEKINCPDKGRHLDGLIASLSASRGYFGFISRLGGGRTRSPGAVCGQRCCRLLLIPQGLGMLGMLRIAFGMVFSRRARPDFQYGFEIRPKTNTGCPGWASSAKSFGCCSVRWSAGWWRCFSGAVGYLFAAAMFLLLIPVIRCDVPAGFSKSRRPLICGYYCRSLSWSLNLKPDGFECFPAGRTRLRTHRNPCRAETLPWTPEFATGCRVQSVWSVRALAQVDVVYAAPGISRKRNTPRVRR